MFKILREKEFCTAFYTLELMGTATLTLLTGNSGTLCIQGERKRLEIGYFLSVFSHL